MNRLQGTTPGRSISVVRRTSRWNGSRGLSITPITAASTLGFTPMGERMYYTQLTPLETAQNFELFRTYTQAFDSQYGTSLWDAVKAIAEREAVLDHK